MQRDRWLVIKQIKMKYKKRRTSDEPKEKRGRPRLRHNIAVQTDLDLSEMTFTDSCEESDLCSTRPRKMTSTPTDDEESTKVTSTSIDAGSSPSSDGNDGAKYFNLQPSPDLQDNVSSSLVSPIKPNSEKILVESNSEMEFATSSSSMASTVAEPSPHSVHRFVIPPLRKTKPRFLTPMPLRPAPLRQLQPLGQSNLRPRLIGQNTPQLGRSQLQTESEGASVFRAPVPESYHVQAGIRTDHPTNQKFQSGRKPGSTEKSDEETLRNNQKSQIPTLLSPKSTMDLGDILNEITQGQEKPVMTTKIKQKGHGNKSRDKSRCQTLRSYTKEVISAKDEDAIPSRVNSGNVTIKKPIGSTDKGHTPSSEKDFEDMEDEATADVGNKDNTDLTRRVSRNLISKELAGRKDINHTLLSGKLSRDARYPEGPKNQKEEANSVCGDTGLKMERQVNRSKGFNIKEVTSNNTNSKQARGKQTNAGPQKPLEVKTDKKKKEAEKEETEKEKTKQKDADKELSRSKKQTEKQTRINQADKASGQKSGVLLKRVSGRMSKTQQQSERVKKHAASKKKQGGAITVTKNKKGTGVTPTALDKIPSSPSKESGPTKMEISTDCTGTQNTRSDEDSEQRECVGKQQSKNASVMRVASTSQVGNICSDLSKMEGKSKEAISGRVVNTTKKVKRKSLINNMSVKKRLRFDKTVEDNKEFSKLNGKPKTISDVERGRSEQTSNTNDKHSLETVGTPQAAKRTNQGAMSEVAAGDEKNPNSVKGLVKDGTKKLKAPRNAVTLVNSRNLEELHPQEFRSEGNQSSLPVGPSSSVICEYDNCKKQYLQTGAVGHPHFNTTSALSCSTTNLLKHGVRRKRKSTASIWCARSRRRRNVLGSGTSQMFPHLDRKILIRIQKLQNLLKNSLPQRERSSQGRNLRSVRVGSSLLNNEVTETTDSLRSRDRSEGKKHTQQVSETTPGKEEQTTSGNVRELTESNIVTDSEKLCKPYQETDVTQNKSATTVLNENLTKGDKNMSARQLCQELNTLTIQNNSFQGNVGTTNLEKVDSQTSFKPVQKSKSMLCWLMDAGPQTKRIPDDYQSVKSPEGQSMEVCDGQFIEVSDDNESADQCHEVSDRQSIDDSDVCQFVEGSDGQSAGGSDSSVVSDGQCMKISGDCQSIEVIDCKSIDVSGCHSIEVSDGQPVVVSDDCESSVTDGQYMKMSDDCQSVSDDTEDSDAHSLFVSDGNSVEVSENGQSLEGFDDCQSAGTSDSQSIQDSDNGQSVELSDGSQAVEISDGGQSLEVSVEGQFVEISYDGQTVEVSDGQSLETNHSKFCVDETVNDGCTFCHLSSNGIWDSGEICSSGKSTSSGVTNSYTSKVINSTAADGGVDMQINCGVKVNRRVDQIIENISHGQTTTADNKGRVKHTRTAKTTALSAIQKLGVHSKPVKTTGEFLPSQSIPETPSCQNDSRSFEGNISEMSAQNFNTNKGVLLEADSSLSENSNCPVSTEVSSNHSGQDVTSSPSGNSQGSEESSANGHHSYLGDEHSPSSTSTHGNQKGSDIGTPQNIEDPVNLMPCNHDDQGQVNSFIDRSSNTMRKHASQKSSYLRGLGGWEDSLRPKPKKTQWFQIKPQQSKPHQSNHKDKKTTDIPSKSPRTSPQQQLETTLSKPIGKSNTVALSTEASSPSPTKGQESHGSTHETNMGCLVWAKLGRDRWWPGLIVPGIMARMPSADQGSSWVYWFGDHKISQIASEKIMSFVNNFSQYFGKKMGKLHRSAVLEAIQLCAKRCGMELLESEDSTLKWAIEGFPIPHDTCNDQEYRPFDPIPGEELPKDVLENLKKICNKVSESAEETVKSRDTRDSALDTVKAGQKKLSDVCIACDDCDKTVYCAHPLFEGGLCRDCKDELTETLFCYGSDGTNVYCVVCGFGGELFVCDSLNCGKAYCTECIELFLGEATMTKIRKASEWQCFLCTDYSSASHGSLYPHRDWQQRIIKLFDTGYRVTDPDLGYLNSENKHQIRVLSLFDGIGTAKLILDNLDVDIDKYYSSEIDEDALLVCSVHHGNEVIQIGDITQLNEEKLRSLCPIDLVIGGSPCNDFSLANPVRKGFELDGTGMLFFHFYRVLKTVQNFNVDRHLFWLYENVASMKSEYKREISAFLECGPALWDSKFFSPQTRARYFWGNIPGMYSTPELSEQYWSSFNLDTMLSPHCNRKATVNRIRTVTTRPNSLRQGKKEDLLPVIMNGKEDSIWISELERVFGFPPHYTDVGNLPPTRRQRLLGKSWSVPVVQHILSPLAQYFAVRKGTDTPNDSKEGE